LEKIKLVVEVVKQLLRKNCPLTTLELHRELCKEGVLRSPDDKVERRKLLRALSTLEEFDYVFTERGSGSGRTPKRWQVNREKFKFLSSYSREEIVALSVLLLFFPRHYRSLPFFKKAIEALTRFANELTPEERELLSFTFERIPNPNERCVELNHKLVEKIFNALLSNRGAYLTYRGRSSYHVYPVKFFTYNGQFYVGGLTDGEYRNFLVSRIDTLELSEKTISLEEKKKRVTETFKIPDERPFVFGALFPESYATEKELQQGFKFFPSQFYCRLVDDGIKVYLVGFTGKRFVSWFLVEKALKLFPPDREMVELAKELQLKNLYKGLSYNLKENLNRFKAFKTKGLEIVKLRLKVFDE